MDKNRKQRLKALIDNRFEGNQQRFADCAAMSKGRVSQLLDDDEPFGERAAKNILVKLSRAGVNLPDNYFDAQQVASAAPGEDVASSKITPQQALAVIQAQLDLQAKASTLVQLERAWPFEHVTREEWLSLTDEQRHVIETVVVSMMNKHSTGSGGQHDKRQAA